MIYKELQKNQKLRRILSILILLLSTVLLALTLYFINNPIIKTNFIDQIIDYANTNYERLGLESIGESTILNASELYDAGIISQKEFEKNKDAIIKITLVAKRKVKVEIFGTNRDTTAPILKLNGPTDITLEYGEKYQEKGYQAIDETDGDITTKIKISGIINENKIGTYQLIYTVIDKAGNQTRRERNIKIVDTTAPVMKLNENDTIYLYLNQDYIEPGATGTDNYDGDLTPNIIINGSVNKNQLGTYLITYTVKDTSGNITTLNRNVIVIDFTSPKIFLKGNATMTIYLNEPYVEPGILKVEDQYDINLKDKIKITGNVNSSKLGTYQITYTAINSRAKTTTIVRTVNVIKAPDVLTDFILENELADIIIPGIYEDNVTRTIDITNIINQYDESMNITNISWHTTGTGVSIWNGLLTVSKHAKAETITITAIANGIVKTIEINLVKVPKLFNFTIEGPNKLSIEGNIENEELFTLTNVKDQYNEDYILDKAETNWSIVGNPSNISITDGILKFTSKREPGEVTIRAENNGVIKTKTIILEKIELSAIELYEGNDKLTGIKSLKIGDIIIATYEITPLNATTQTGTWLSSDPSKVIVDNGEIEVIAGEIGDQITITVMIDNKNTSFIVEIIE